MLVRRPGFFYVPEKELIAVNKVSIETFYQEEKMNHYEKFEQVVREMNIPDNRKTANKPNALWFLQQGVALNKEHPKILTAIFHAQRM